jgi:hypothetical protein
MTATLLDEERAADLLAHAVWLVDEGACSPMCLFGGDKHECACRCGERWHGFLRTVRARAAEVVPLADLLVDACPGWPRECESAMNTPYFIRKRREGFLAFYRCADCTRHWSCGWGSLMDVAQLYEMRPTEIRMQLGQVAV